MATNLEDHEWRDPANWHGGWLGIYSAPRDPRIWVPKRRPWMGTTLNFAHRSARVTFTAVLAVPVLVTALVALLAWAHDR